MKKLSNLKGAKMLTKQEQQSVNGGEIDCLECPTCPAGQMCCERTGQCVDRGYHLLKCYC